MPRFSTTAASYRAKTEDRALVLPVPAGWIVCVADGTGGSSGGAEAADLFISGIQRASGSVTFRMGEPAVWVALFEALDAEIARAPLAGETTGVALAVVSVRLSITYQDRIPDAELRVAVARTQASA